MISKEVSMISKKVPMVSNKSIQPGSLSDFRAGCFFGDHGFGYPSSPLALPLVSLVLAW